MKHTSSAISTLSNGGQSEPWTKKLVHDFLSSIVVFLIALPLCMAIAQASDVPVAAGVISGIIGGVVVGCLSGAPLQVSGPAAGLFVLVLALVKQHGIEALGPVIIVAGAFQLLAGFLRMGQWFRAVSPAVVQGMLAGIGVLIFASQFHVVVDDAPRDSGIQNLLSIPESVAKGIGIIEDNGTANHHYAAQIGVLTILILAFWKMLIPKKLKFIPAPLAAVVIATATADILQLDIRFISLPENLFDAIKPPTLESLSQLDARGFGIGAIILSGLSFCLVASAETLLSVTATDRMHQGPRARYDKELMAQGVGNMLCGAASALPITGVIVRSSANIDAGARTRWSAVMHGFWLLLCVWMLPNVLQKIPTACLGAILVYTGYKLVNPKAISHLWAYGKSEVGIYAATLVGIVALDLLTGVLIGIALSAVKLLYTFSRLRITLSSQEGSKRMLMTLEGTATFLKLPKLAQVLEQIPAGAELHVDVSQVAYIDHACLDLLMSWRQQHEDLGGKLTIDWGQLHAKFFSGPAPENGNHTGQAHPNGSGHGKNGAERSSFEPPKSLSHH